MRTPSINALSTIFDDKAKQAKHILTCSRDELLEMETSAYLLQRTSYGKHSTEYLRLVELNDLGDFHGVECVECENGQYEGTYAQYLNAGDIYNGTLILWQGNWRVTTLGDFIETMERRGVRFV